MCAARFHRLFGDDTAISSMNSTNRSKYYCTTLLFVVDNPLSKYFILLYSVFLLWHGNGI